MPDQPPSPSPALPGPTDALAPSGLLVGEGPFPPSAPYTEGTPEAAAVAAVAEVGVARKKLGVAFWVSAGWVGLMIVLACIANLLPLDNPTEVGVGLPGMGPSLHHLFGTDEIGRDLFSRIIFGSRVSLTVGFASIAFGLLIGGTLGLVAGFYRGKLDAFITGSANILLAFPALVFALAIVTFLGQGLRNVTLAIGILAIAPLTLVVRGSTIVFSQREFVLAARMLGAKSRRIIYREVLANVVPAALSLALVSIAVAIVAEGALAFLGLSVRAPTPTWGGMISEGRVVLAQHPLIALWPSVFMFITVLALNFAGDRLRSYFDVKEGGV